ncbi:MAG: MBL fold metallo-hydrolase [Betaproteobacteria bacterium]|nr:MBL fold metallo-hydrolase [Betaproteobacteria bacterium]
MKLKSWLALSAALLTTTVFAQQNFDKVEIKTQKLSDTTYMMIGAGGNLGLSIGEDAVFLIDDQFAPLTPKIEAAIKALTDKPVKFVINTHWHGDHTGGNTNLGKAGAMIVAHDNVRKRLSSEQFIAFLQAKEQPTPKPGLPVVSFSQEVTFHINGDEILAFHVPKAHTDGDTIIHFRKDNVIHMGDNYFNGFYPFIDTSSGGTPDGVIAAADRVLSIADDKTRIIPGHGPLSNKAELKVFRDMLATSTMRIKALAKAGKKLEEVIAAKPTAEFDERWGKGFIPTPRFIEMVYNAVK